MVVEKAVPRHVDDASLQRLLRREGDRMDDEIELAPRLGDPFEHRLHLARHAHVERHDDRRFEFACERLDVFLGLVVEIGHREFGAERAECLGAAPGDRMFIGNADDEALSCPREAWLSLGGISVLAARSMVVLPGRIDVSAGCVAGGDRCNEFIGHLRHVVRDRRARPLWRRQSVDRYSGAVSSRVARPSRNAITASSVTTRSTGAST